MQMLLNAAQAAALMGISERTFHQWRKTGLLPPGVAISPGRVRWARADLESAIAAAPRKLEVVEPARLIVGKAARSVDGAPGARRAGATT